MKYILLQIKIDSTAVAAFSSGVSPSNNYWFWLSLLELGVILYLFFKLASNKKKLLFSDLKKENLKKSKESNIDMGNLISSINNSSELYKELSRKCHPDRFVNSPHHQVAGEIFQEIARHKRNHEKLVALKERAIAELEIKL